MESDIKYAIPAVNRVNKSFEKQLFPFDLLSLVEKMKKKSSWVNAGINSIILLKNADEHIVLTAVHSGTEIVSFQSGDSIKFQVFEGNLKFHSRRELINIEKGQTLTVYEKIKYKLTADEETIFLISIRKKIGY